VILNRSAGAVNDAVLQAPQNVTTAEYYLTSQYSNAAGQPTSVSGGRVTVNIPAQHLHGRAHPLKMLPGLIARYRGGRCRATLARSAECQINARTNRPYKKELLMLAQ
jgi:hypothetical protein